MRKYLDDILFRWNINVAAFDESELLQYFDNPDNFYVKDSRTIEDSVGMPSNFLVSLTHWEYMLPSWWEEVLLKPHDIYLRLLQNFSDFWTAYIAKWMNIPEEQIIRNKYSRWIWDCNRNIHDTSITWYLRETDFSWNVLFSGMDVFSTIAEKHYYDYHNSIIKWLESIEKRCSSSFLFDLHDTGVRLMKPDINQDTIKHDVFPAMSIANLDNTSCDNKVLEYFSEKITKYLWIPVILNDPYKWWYVTKYHWIDSVRWKNSNRNVIQIELARFLYMKESSQEIHIKRAEIIWNWLSKAMRDTVIRFS